MSSFIISLDFEIHWGVCDRDNSLTTYRENLLNVREVVPRLLELFVEFEVNATWATVGLLFFESKEELLHYLPELQPRYDDPKLSAYRHLPSLGNDESDDPFHFAPSLIRRIAETPGQEIGSHTFSHYYCLEQEQDRETFEADLSAAVTVAALRGLELKSLVFPRNQVASDYLASLSSHGFTSFRGNPRHWMYAPTSGAGQSKLRRASRLADAYFPITKSSSRRCANNEPITNLPASRFLRPYSKRLKSLEALRIQRIKRELERAARDGEDYHLWWHPHNFGANLPENLMVLRSILEHFETLREVFGMTSGSMVELSEERSQ